VEDEELNSSRYSLPTAKELIEMREIDRNRFMRTFHQGLAENTKSYNSMLVRYYNNLDNFIKQQDDMYL